MRLPTKTEVEKERVLERQAEMKEGLQLAKKVDAVRLELLKEQNNLEKFRKETTVIVQKEIDDLLHKKQNLTFENEVLERHNKNLKAPFDAEWENIRQTTLNDLDEQLEEIENDKVFIEAEKAQIASIMAQNVKDREMVKLTIEQSARERLEAKEKLQCANDILEMAKIQVAEHQSRIDAENNQLSRKEEQLALTLRDIQVREAAIQKSARQLARRERFINSKYKALENAQRELNK